MKTKIIEATDGSHFNYGKFLLGRFTEEWQRRQAIDPSSPVTSQSPLLTAIGISSDALLVLDLQTGEGALFYPHPENEGACAVYDLERQKIWVCPLFQPFLQWVYRQDPRDLQALDVLPDRVNLGAVPTALRGYRRSGVSAESAPLIDQEKE